MSLATYFLPFCAAIIYTFATICMKRSIEGGAGIMRALFITNCLAAAIQLVVLLVLRPPLPALSDFIMPAACGVIFFFAQFLIFMTIRFGDVTIQIPMLGIKVVFVSIFLIFFTQAEVSNRIMAASAITTVAVFLLGLSSVSFSKKTLFTMLAVIIANSGFAFSDCMTQIYAAKTGLCWFLSINYTSVMLCSFALIPIFKAPLSAIPKQAYPWILSGSFLMCIQGFMLIIAIGVFKIAALANIIYSTRGLWSIVIVWFLGRHFGIHEHGIGKRLMLQRFVGAALLFTAVVVAIV